MREGPALGFDGIPFARRHGAEAVSALRGCRGGGPSRRRPRPEAWEMRADPGRFDCGSDPRRRPENEGRAGRRGRGSAASIRVSANRDPGLSVRHVRRGFFAWQVSRGHSWERRPGNARVPPARGQSARRKMRAGHERSRDDVPAQAAPWGEIRQRAPRTDPEPWNSAVRVGGKYILTPALHAPYRYATNSDPRLSVIGSP